MKPADGWVPLAETARSAGVPERTMLRRMTALHHQLGGGILRSYNMPGSAVRKWFLNANALRAEVADYPADDQIALGEHLLRIETLEVKVKALRDSHVALKNKVKRLTPPADGA